MWTKEQYAAAQKAVRADIDTEAGWYAHMISDQMIAKIIGIAVNAAATAAPK